MEKILTIVIPTYNMEKYLDKCLTSLIIDDKELMKQLEVLVVIDGAKDRSSEIAHTYQDKYPETFRVIDKDNGNYGSCVNRGLKEATGKYIKVLDADDWFDTNSFYNYLLQLRKVDVDLFINDYTRVYANGALFRHTFKYEVATCLNSHLLDLNVDSIEMHAITYRTALLKDIKYKQTEGISYTDTEWSIIPLLHIKIFMYLNINLYQYRIGRAGQTIDTETSIARHDNLTTVALSIIDYCNRFRTLYEAMPYISLRLKNVLSYIYEIIIIEDKCNRQENLIEFDKVVKHEYPLFYDLINDCYAYIFYKYYFIRVWRNRGFRKLPFYVPLMLYGYSIYTKIKLFGRNMFIKEGNKR